MDAVPALDQEYRKTPRREQRGLTRRKPRHHLPRHAQWRGKIGEQRSDPRAGGDDGAARLVYRLVGHHPHAADARLDRAHCFAGAQHRAGGLRERQHCMDRRLGREHAAVGLQHGDEIGRQPESREAPHCVRRGQDLVREPMQTGRGERAAHQDAVGRADLGDPGDMEQLLPGGAFKFAPQLVGAVQKRHVGGMLPIGQPDDAGRAMRGAAIVAGREALEPEHAVAPAGDLVERRASHGAEPAHDDIE